MSANLKRDLGPVLAKIALIGEKVDVLAAEIATLRSKLDGIAQKAQAQVVRQEPQSGKAQSGGGYGKPYRRY